MDLHIAVLAIVLLATMGLPLFVQTRPSPETVTFPTNVVPNSSANKGGTKPFLIHAPKITQMPCND